MTYTLMFKLNISKVDIGVEDDFVNFLYQKANRILIPSTVTFFHIQSEKLQN